MSVRCVWANLNPEADARGSWDQMLVEELTAGYEHSEFSKGMNPAPISAISIFTADQEWQHLTIGADEGAVVVIPGQHNWTKYAKPLAELVAALPWALTIVTSDEEALFPVELLPHDDKHLIWGQYHARPEFDRVIPIGLPPNTRETLAAIEADHPARMGDVFFAGQNTHARREELLDVMKEMAAGYPQHGNLAWVATTGFRAGLDQERYLRGMRDARIAPCPSGYHSLDSFRLYEALAAGCIPIIETTTPDGREENFWLTMFGNECPIPMVESWHELPELVDDIQRVVLGEPPWCDLRDKIAEWWAIYLYDLAAEFKSTIARLQS